MSQQHTAARTLPDRSSGGSLRGTVQWKQANTAGSLPPVPTPLHEKGARGWGHMQGLSRWAVAVAAMRWNKLENETIICKAVKSHPGCSPAAKFALCKRHPCRRREACVKPVCDRLDPGKAHEAVPFWHLIKKIFWRGTWSVEALHWKNEGLLLTLRTPSWKNQTD